MPEHTVSLFRGFISCRVKHFPALFVAANMLSGPLLGTDTAFWLALIGFLVSWVYLRFYRITEISTSSATGGEGTRMKGDASDTFSFVAFFPDALHPVLAPICDGVWNALVQMRVCTPFSDEAIEAGNENAATRNESLPSLMNGRGSAGGRRAEAERRRALALKALDQRLNAAAAGRGPSAPGGGGVNIIAPTLSSDSSERPASAGADDAETIEEAQA